MPDPTTLNIIEIIPSWGGSITMVPPARWNEVVQATYQATGVPDQATIFENNFVVAPMPSTGSIAFTGIPSGSILTFYAHRFRSPGPINAVSGSIVPLSCERALIYGVCAEYDPKWLPLYEQELSQVFPTVHMPGINTIEASW